MKSVDVDGLIDTLFLENKILDRIKRVFLILVIGVALGYAWAYKVFG